MSKEQKAFDAAVNIAVATLSDDSISPGIKAGETVGDYFQALYQKLLEVAPEND